MLWFLYSLLSGFFLATSDVFAKKSRLEDDYIIAWSRFFFSIPVVAVLIFFVTIPKLDIIFWITILFAIPLEIIALLLYVKAIRASPLSLTLPYLSLTPVFLIFTSWIFLGEFVTMLGILGILLVVLGAYALNMDKKNNLFGPFKNVFKEKGSLLMVIVAFIFSITANLGKIAILHSNALFFFVFFIFAMIIILSVMFFKRIKSKIESVKSNITSLILTGLFFGLMILFHFLAIALILVPYMISIKRTSSIFGVIYGRVWFKEKYFAQRMIGAAIMVVGAAVILLS